MPSSSCSPSKSRTSGQGTCTCRRRRSSNTTTYTTSITPRRLFIATLALFITTTSACTSSFPHPVLDISSPTSHAGLLLRRSPSPQGGSGAAIVLADPSDTTTDTTTTVGEDTSTSLTPSLPIAIEDVGALPAGYSFPQPFDAVLGVNFTSTSCPSFFNRFLADPAFKACSPLSLLLETSTSFFKAMQDPTLLPPVLDQICSADADTCLDLMDQYALQIDQSSTCGPDLRQGNALAVSALNGFRNYKLYFQAGCLKDSNSENYCFAEAANATLPSDLYIYYLPGGTSLPSGEKPTCNTCSKSVMSTFSNYASNSTLRISETYVNARNVIALSCGPSFAPMVAATVTTSGSATQHSLLSYLVTLVPAVAAASLLVGL